MKDRRALVNLLLGALLLLLGWQMMTFESRMLYYPDHLAHPDARHYLDQTELLAGRVQEVTFTSEAGVEIYAWYLPPPGADQPTIVFAHGNAGHVGHRWPVIHAFAEREYGVFAFDYRGYGLSSGRPKERGLYRDMQAASQYLSQQQGIPAERQVAVGESIGGAVVIEAGTHIPFQAIMIYSTFTSVPDAARHIARRDGMGVLQTLIPLLFRQRYDSLSRIGQIQSPLLVVHGAEDTMIPPTMAETLYEQAPPPKQLLIIPGADHNNIFNRGGEAMLDALEALLEESNKTDQTRQEETP